jgi:hypothetical protein
MQYSTKLDRVSQMFTETNPYAKNAKTGIGSKAQNYPENASLSRGDLEGE